MPGISVCEKDTTMKRINKIVFLHKVFILVRG